MTWPIASLGEICEFKYGKSLPAAKRQQGSIPVYGSNGLVGRHAASASLGATIIVGRKGSFGEVHFSQGACWPIDTTYYIDKSATNVDLRWLFHMLPLMGLKNLNRAAAVPGLNREDAYRQQIPLPPLDEQRRVATILDAVESLLSHATRSTELLGNLKVAIFAERFEKGKNTRTCSVGQFVTSIDNGRSPLCEPRVAMEDEWGVLKLSAVSYGEFRPAENKLLPPHEHIDYQNEVRAGDLLVSRKNTRELVGATVLVTKTRPKLLLPDLIFRLNVDETQVDKSYLAALLMRPGPRAAVRDLAGGSAASMMNISKARLMNLKVPVAPLVEQQEFARDLARIDSSLPIRWRRFERLQALKASLATRAFSGKL